LLFFWGEKRNQFLVIQKTPVVITSIGFFNGRNFLDKKIQQKLSCCLIQKNWEIIGICHLVQIQVRFAHLVGGGGGSNFLI
jgi:hypothetical protein